MRLFLTKGKFKRTSFIALGPNSHELASGGAVLFGLFALLAQHLRVNLVRVNLLISRNL